MTDASGNLRARAASGAAWLTAQTVISRITSLATQLLLARLLVPEHFGQIGLVYTITAFTAQLVTPGVEDVLLQKQKHLRRWISPAFWLSMACGAGGAVLMVLLGLVVMNLARHFGNDAYGDPRLIWMILILACAAPLNAAALVPMVVLRSELRFARVAAINFGEVVSQQALLVLFAVWGMGAYSFVLPMPIVAAVRCALLWVKVRPPVRVHLSVHRWPALISSTRWVFGYRLLATLTSNGDYMVLGAMYADKVLVGQYFFAYMLSIQILRMLSDNIGAVLMPALNMIHKDQARMEHAVERASRLLAVMVIPVATLQILLAGPTMRLLFGHKWEPAIPLVQLLSVGPLFMAAVWPMGSMLQAQGRFREIFWYWVAVAIAFFAIVAPLTWFWAAAGTASGVGLWLALTSPLAAALAYRSRSGAKTLMAAMARPLMAAAAGAVPGAIIVRLIPHSRPMEMLAIALVTAIFAVIYLGVIRWADPRLWELTVQQIGAVVKPLARISRATNQAIV